MAEPEGDDPLPIEQEESGKVKDRTEATKAWAETVLTRARRQLLVIV